MIGDGYVFFSGAIYFATSNLNASWMSQESSDQYVGGIKAQMK